jgi:hypothetical protein
MLPLAAVLIIWSLGPAILAAWLAGTKGRDGLAWFCAAILFGWLALLAIGLSDPASRSSHGRCPSCGEHLDDAAIVCRCCGYRLSREAALAGIPLVKGASRDALEPIGRWVLVESTVEKLATRATVQLALDRDRLALVQRTPRVAVVVLDEPVIELCDEMFIRIEGRNGARFALDWVDGPKALETLQILKVVGIA